jgi:hypothetical protein
LCPDFHIEKGDERGRKPQWVSAGAAECSCTIANGRCERSVRVLLGRFIATRHAPSAAKNKAVIIVRKLFPLRLPPEAWCSSLSCRKPPEACVRPVLIMRAPP